MFYTEKTKISLNKKFLSLMVVGCFVAFGFAQQPIPRKITIEDPLIQKFYTINNNNLFWTSSNKNIKKANEWLSEIESSNNFGLGSNKLQIDQIRVALSNHNKTDNTLKEKTDQQITGLILNFIKYLQQGNISFDYDEVSIQRDSIYLYQLLHSNKAEHVSKLVSRLECKDHDYLVLKRYLNDSITIKDTLKYKKVLLAMNYRKYLTVNHQSEYIVVNIPTTEAEYYRDNVLALKMHTVVGRKKTPTPTIASYITSIVTFPSWNVPHTIAVTEILPKIQKDENYLEQNNFDVVDAKGNVVEDSELNWKDYTKNNFPYFFRQSTGADNSLGVLKFNLQNPFSIFLHSSSTQVAFVKDFRFLSHGCIRLENPFKLADALLRGQIDIEELKSGKKNTESNTIPLPHKIPVFIIYMPVTVIGNKVAFLPDVYGLIK